MIRKYGNDMHIENYLRQALSLLTKMIDNITEVLGMKIHESCEEYGWLEV